MGAQKVGLLCAAGAVLLAVLCSATGASTFLGPYRARSAFRTARQAERASAGKLKDAGDDEDMLYSEEDEYGDEFDEEEGDYMELDGPPPEVLDGWEKDEMAMALLANFQSEEFEGKKVMSFRDVAMLLEVLGLEREQFVAIFTGQGGMEDEFDDDFLDEEEEMMLKEQFERGYGGGGPGGGGGRGRGGGGGGGRGGGGGGGRGRQGGGGRGGGGGGRGRGRRP